MSDSGDTTALEGLSASAPRAVDVRPGSMYEDRGMMRNESLGKARRCPSCRGVMSKSSRLILSPLAGLAVALAGFAFMAGYGVVTNFYQPPWYAKFCLPALYYIGSLLVGAGLLFFFIRERVWRCARCREIVKR